MLSIRKTQSLMSNMKVKKVMETVTTRKGKVMLTMMMERDTAAMVTKVKTVTTTKTTHIHDWLAWSSS